MYHITLKLDNKVVNIFDIVEKDQLVKYFIVPYLMDIQFQFDGNNLQRNKITNLRIIETNEYISDIVKKVNKKNIKEKPWPIMRTKEIIITDPDFGDNITEKIIEEGKRDYKKMI
jgi:hypothetical protein